MRVTEQTPDEEIARDAAESLEDAAIELRDHPELEYDYEGAVAIVLQAIHRSRHTDFPNKETTQ